MHLPGALLSAYASQCIRDCQRFVMYTHFETRLKRGRPRKRPSQKATESLPFIILAKVFKGLAPAKVVHLASQRETTNPFFTLCPLFLTHSPYYPTTLLNS